MISATAKITHIPYYILRIAYWHIPYYILRIAYCVLRIA